MFVFLTMLYNSILISTYLSLQARYFLYFVNFANFAKFWVLNLAFREIPKAQNFVHCITELKTKIHSILNLKKNSYDFLKKKTQIFCLRFDYCQNYVPEKTDNRHQHLIVCLKRKTFAKTFETFLSSNSMFDNI